MEYNIIMGNTIKITGKLNQGEYQKFKIFESHLQDRNYDSRNDLKSIMKMFKIDQTISCHTNVFDIHDDMSFYILLHLNRKKLNVAKNGWLYHSSPVDKLKVLKGWNKPKDTYTTSFNDKRIFFGLNEVYTSKIGNHTSDLEDAKEKLLSSGMHLYRVPTDNKEIYTDLELGGPSVYIVADEIEVEQLF